jgi:hypothetical protein
MDVPYTKETNKEMLMNHGTEYEFQWDIECQPPEPKKELFRLCNPPSS